MCSLVANMFSLFTVESVVFCYLSFFTSSNMGQSYMDIVSGMMKWHRSTMWSTLLEVRHFELLQLAFHEYQLLMMASMLFIMCRGYPKFNQSRAGIIVNSVNGKRETSQILSHYQYNDLCFVVDASNSWCNKLHWLHWKRQVW